MVKKILKGLGIFLLISFLLLLAAPFLFKGKIIAFVTETINKNLDATVAFEDVDISLIRNFPKASVVIHDLSIINKAPFEGDTLVYAKEISLAMSIKELFKNQDEGMHIQSFAVRNSLINIMINEEGIGNFDIALKTEDEEKEEQESSPFKLQVQKYELENIEVRYADAGSKMKVTVDELNHRGSGNFSDTKLDLNTHTDAKLSLSMDQTNYMNKVALQLDAVLGIDMENNRYEFKNNEAYINQLPLQFDGYLQLVEAGQQMAISFETPSSSFTNFLGLIPSAYSGSLDNIKTSGDFSVKGVVDGLYSENTIPKLDIALIAKNGSFQYPDLPKSVNDIFIDTHVKNETGLAKDTYVNINTLSLRIDQDVFNANASIRDITDNVKVKAALKGVINLGNLTKAYPVQLDQPLSGILKADVTTQFDMLSVEQEQYQNIQNAGVISLNGFRHTDESGKAIDITEAVVQFNPRQLNLQKFEAKTGKSDLNASGILDNFYGFLFNSQDLKGNFNVTSNQIAVSDFMTSDSPQQSGTNKDVKDPGDTTSEPMKIPAFLDCTITARANTVLYDNLQLKDVSGKLIIKDETVTLENLKTNIFNGQIAVNGKVSTKTATPKFDMDLGFANVDIPQVFSQLEMLKKIAPIAGVIAGKLNSTIKVSGDLDPKELTPDLATISGDLMGQLLNASVKSENSKILSALDNNLAFIDMDKINLNNLKAALRFDNGKVNVQPFNLNYQDITLQVGGSHGFDQNMNYNIKMDVPAKYLGSEVNNLIAKLTPSDAKKIDKIPINALLTGNFSSPKVSTDVKQATSSLVNQLVEQQKQALINQGTSAVTDLINKNIKSSDSTKTTIPTTKEEVKDKVEEAKEKAEDKVKQGVRNLLNKKN